MGFRFRRSVRVLPGVRLNFSKSGMSTSIGGRGFTTNIGAKGVRHTVGLPGSGVSYSSYKPYRAAGEAQPLAELDHPPANPSGPRWGWVAALVLTVVAISQSQSPTPVSTGAPMNVTAPTPVMSDAGMEAVSENDIPPPPEAHRRRSRHRAGVSAPLIASYSSHAFRNCSEARAAGAAPVMRGNPGYAPRLDRDGDGVGCE